MLFEITLKKFDGRVIVKSEEYTGAYVDYGVSSVRAAVFKKYNTEDLESITIDLIAD